MSIHRDQPQGEPRPSRRAIACHLLRDVATALESRDYPTAGRLVKELRGIGRPAGGGPAMMANQYDAYDAAMNWQERMATAGVTSR